MNNFKMLSPSVIVIAFVLSTISGQLLEVAKAVTNTDAANFEAAFQGKCGPSSPCVQLCVELHDGTFECQCRAGYRLLVDGYSCVELTNTTMSDDSSEEEEEWQMELAKRQQQQSGEPNKAPEARTVTRDITSEYKRRKNLAGAAAAASSAAVSSTSDTSFNGLSSNVRPLPLPLASLSGDKRKTMKVMTRKPTSIINKQRETADAAISAMNAAAEAAFSFGKPPQLIPPTIPTITYQTTESTKKESLLDAAGLADDDENYEDDYDESKEGEDDSSEEYDDDDEDDELSLEGEEDLDSSQQQQPTTQQSSKKGDKDKSNPTTITTPEGDLKTKDGEVKSLDGGEIMDESDEAEEFLIASPESTSVSNSNANTNGKLKDLYSNSYVDGDSNGLEFSWNKDGQLEKQSKVTPSPITFLGDGEMDNVVGLSGSSSSGSISSSTTEKQEVECPLKCNRGSCTREPSNESGLEQSMTGYRCLCPMGTRGTFCEIEEIPEEGSGYNSGLFRGQSWVAFPVLHDAYMSDQISLEFRPESANGILLLTGEREDLSGDFLALYIRDGYLEFRFDCGSGSGMVRSATPVLLQQWNRASIVRRRWDGWMQLNDGPFTQGRSKGLFSRITFRQPVFIGGPGNITFTATGSTPTNFDDEPELSPPPPLSSSTTLSLSSSPSISSASTSDNWTSASSQQQNQVGSSTPDRKEDMVEGGEEFFVAPASVIEDPTASSTVVSAISNTNQGAAGEPSLESDSSGSSDSGSSSITSDTNDSTSIASLLKKTGGFRGCIRNLVINDRAYRFGLEPAGDSLQGFDIESCNDQGVCDLVKCQHGGQCLVQKDENPTCLCPLGFSGPFCETPLDLQIPSFNGSSYLKYSGLGLTRVLSWLELEIVVKPDAMDGLILYNGYKTDGMGDFIALTIDQGYFEFAMDLGTGTAIVRSESSVSLGEWHRILISRTSRLISIKVDNQPPVMALTPGAFTQLSLPHNLFLGGIPDPQWLSPKVKVHGGFSGCIQKLVVNERPLRIMGSAMSGVNLENCAHPCLRNPCDHGGDCIPQLDAFKCHCPLGYRDPFCQTRMDKEDIITAPRFIGDSYLRFSHPRIVKRISGWKLSLSFRVRTSVSRGLLLWAGRKWMTSASDFISVGLRNGFVTASFSLGSGQTTIAYNITAINDGRWHHVHFFRNEQEASLAVDDGPPVTGVAPGKLRQLNINDGLYIGGLEDPRHQSMNKYTEGLVGCLTDLVLGGNYRVSLLQEASEGRNVDYCD